VMTDEFGVPGGRDCVAALFNSGGIDGCRAMLGVGYVSARVEAWKEQIKVSGDIPSAVKDMANDV
jgi:hypothetical protein